MDWVWVDIFVTYLMGHFWLALSLTKYYLSKKCLSALGTKKLTPAQSSTLLASLLNIVVMGKELPVEQATIAGKRKNPELISTNEVYQFAIH